MKTTIKAPTPKGYSNAYGFTITINGGSLPQPAHPEGCFSVTGDIYHKATRSRGHDGTRECGCLHDKIVQAFPSLKFLVSMHLSDAKTGEPSHAEGNGFYQLAGACPEVCHFGEEYHSASSIWWFPDGRRTPTPDECLAMLADHLRCTVEEARAIKMQVVQAWNAAPKVPACAPYPLNTEEHRKAVQDAEKEAIATPSKTARETFARIIDGMRPRWAFEASLAHAQIKAIAERAEGVTIREAIESVQ